MLGAGLSAGCASKGELVKVRGDLDRCANDLAAVTAERDRVTGDLRQLRESWNAVRNENEAARLIEQLRADVTNREREVAQKGKERDEAAARAADLERRLADFDRSNRDMQTAHAKLKEEHDALAQLLAYKMRGAEYQGVGEAHYVKANVDRGAMIVLDDGSIWNVDRLSRLDASLWMRLDNIVVVPNSAGLAPYKLVNTSQNEAAEATLVGYR